MSTVKNHAFILATVMIIAAGFILTTSTPFTLDYDKNGASSSGYIRVDPWGIVGIVLVVMAITLVRSELRSRRQVPARTS